MVRKHQTEDVQLHIGESRDSGFDAVHRPRMTEWDCFIAYAPLRKRFAFVAGSDDGGGVKKEGPPN
jgi:hypothetical protein